MIPLMDPATSDKLPDFSEINLLLAIKMAQLAES
jgi:hypothetical protein